MAIEDSDIPRALELRKRHGLTLEGLAEKVGCDPSALSRYERGERRTPITIAKALARELRVSLELLTAPIEEAQADG